MTTVTGSIVRQEDPRADATTMRPVVRGALSGYVLQSLSVPLTLAGSIYLLRTLSTAEYGVLALLLAINLYVSVISHLGIPMAIVRYVPEYRGQGRHRAVWGLLGWAFLLRYAALAVILTVVSLTIAVVARLLNAPSLAVYFPLLVLFVVVDVGVQMWSAVLEGLLQQVYVNVVQVVFAAVKLAFLVALLAGGQGLPGAITALLLADLVLLGLYAVRAVRVLLPDRGGLGLEGDLGRLARYCRSWYLGKLSCLVFDDSTDLYLVSFFLGPAAAGLYAFAYNAGSQAIRLLSPSAHLWSALTPASVDGARKDPGLLTGMFRLTTKAVVFFGAPAIAGAFVLGERGIGYVFGAQYVPAALVFALWAVTVCLNELEQPVRMLMVIREKVGVLFVNRVLVVYNLALAILLIPRVGIEGAIVATSTTTLLALVVTYLAAGRHQPLPFPWPECGRMVASAALVAAVLLLVRPWITGLGSLLAAAGLGAVLYLGLAWLLNPFTLEERALVRGGLSARIGAAPGRSAAPA